jgi:hypothetical protein|tara:strand:+ start:175 stop:405 length:231 start_codon:yes stop_codon:yes gene_type:complete
MAIINPWTVGAVITAGKAVWNGTKWVKQMKKLKKGGGSTVTKVQSGNKLDAKHTYTSKDGTRIDTRSKYFKKIEGK